MKMAVVGCEASGKTVFMCALADYYGRAGADDPMRLKLTPDNAAANSFERYQFRQMRCLRQWPSATPPERTIGMKWTLRRGAEPVTEVDMLEFGGETFRAAFREQKDGEKHEESVKELMDYLSDADFFVVLVSIKALLADPKSASDKDYNRETESLWVTRGILEFIRTHRPQAGIVIGLTQADRYRNEIGEAGGARQLFAERWPTVAALAQGIPVVEVASVSRTDENGDPADGYRTHGILPVMRAFAKHCFGNEEALENPTLISKKRKLPPWTTQRKLAFGALLAVTVGAIAIGVHRAIPILEMECPHCHPHQVKSDANPMPVIIEKTVTNTVERLVQTTVTNEVPVFVDRVVEREVTNTVDRIIEREVTNTVDRIIEREVTNTVDRIVETVVTNTVQSVVTNTVQSVVTNTVEVKVERNDAISDYRIWTDYNGNCIIGKWLSVSPDGNGITILTKNGRTINAVKRKFSVNDQNFIESEIEAHRKRGELMSDGKWVPDPMLKR